MSKLTFHLQAAEGWVGEALGWWGATHVKGVGCYPSYPGVTTIGRVYYPQDLVDARVREGEAGADEMWEYARPTVEANPQVGIWETPANEASIWQAGVAARWVAFNQRLIRRFHEAGKRIVVGAVNTGWPRLPAEDGGAMMRLIVEASRGADGLSFHEYGREDMREGATYDCLRYIRFHNFCLANGHAHPPIYVTECGLDRTAPPGPDYGHAGWREVLKDHPDPAGEYAAMLAWYEAELQKDDYVVMGSVFTTAPDWGSFRVDRDLAWRVAELLWQRPAPDLGDEIKHARGHVTTALEMLE